MTAATPDEDEKEVDRGVLTFSIESRILRELGERLVKRPEVALVELVKNAYDADATECTIDYQPRSQFVVSDNGHGMSLEQFRKGWMRIGTSSKTASSRSPQYRRSLTGEKGIGRFAVRFLGHHLVLESVAQDPRGYRTRLRAVFNWPEFDLAEDLGRVKVPYTLTEVRSGEPSGTTLTITKVRSEARSVDLYAIRTGSLNVLSPLSTLLRSTASYTDKSDPGFSLRIAQGHGDSGDYDEVASRILDSYTLRADVHLTSAGNLSLKVFTPYDDQPYLSIAEKYKADIGALRADIRFFPRRSGAFRDIGLDGRIAYTWIHDHSGVAVFDRGFRIQPYGSTGDDWLRLQTDRAGSSRDPRSTLAEKHFPMSQQEKGDTGLNWMLRLPKSLQLVGVVEVAGSRDRSEGGLIAAADREGFVENEAFRELWNLIRGAVEAIAYVDRQVSLEDERAAEEERAAAAQAEASEAIEQVRASQQIPQAEKRAIISAISATAAQAEDQRREARQREQQLETMGLLGVVAGFMTHEFGAALTELEEAQHELEELAKTDSQFESTSAAFARHAAHLREFVSYSTAYIQGSRKTPDEAFPVRPRLQQVRRIFGRYADERDIKVSVDVEGSVLAPRVPASLYNGIALNLYTNALKAVTARPGQVHDEIAFRAWNEGGIHVLEVSDTGVGIPPVLRSRIFDPFFTTTRAVNDPLGSGMGLGLSLVRRGVAAFGGKVAVVEPPPGFATCLRVELPLNQD